MENVKNDSYLAQYGMENAGLLKTSIAYFKIAVIAPILFLWVLFKILIKPKRSHFDFVRRSVVLPLFEFFEGDNAVSQEILKDYTNIHNTLLHSKSDEELKLNLENHYSISTQTKVSTMVTSLIFMFIYVELMDYIQILGMVISASVVALSMPWLAPLTIGVTYVALAYLAVSLFIIEAEAIKSFFYTTREEIKDYLESAISYADIKVREIFGDEHANKVKEVLLMAYLTEKPILSPLDDSLVKQALNFDKQTLIGNQK